VPLNLIPDGINVDMPTAEEFARYVIRRTLGALGLASLKEMAWRGRRVKGNLIKTELEKMIAEGEVYTAGVEGLKTTPFYILTGQQTAIELAGDAFILSPFDILNVFRHRLREFFDFDYQIECFVPAPKRKYGYFSLPVLVGDTFVARMDAKADRKQKLLIVHNLHFEDREISDLSLGKIAEALQAYVHFNQCRDITFKKSNRQRNLDTIKSYF